MTLTETVNADIATGSESAQPTDTAAPTETAAPVVEGFGLRGFGSHTTNAEYILMSSIEPRLYLATRMIMDISSGKAPLQ